jgi:hypothetical protein
MTAETKVILSAPAKTLDGLAQTRLLTNSAQRFDALADARAARCKIPRR